MLRPTVTAPHLDSTELELSSSDDRLRRHYPSVQAVMAWTDYPGSAVRVLHPHSLRMNVASMQ
jgi:hypothetical protein